MNRLETMDTRASKTTFKRYFALLLAASALAFAGCDVKVTDLTPPSMKANPSNVYTITAQVAVTNSAVVKESVVAEVIINGKAHPMQPAPGGSSLYEYDFKMPSGFNEARYYLLIQYDRKRTEGTTRKEISTELSSFRVERRYSVDLEVDRAPVGTKVAILGRGFSSSDKVMVGDVAAATRLESSTSLAFYVPSMPEGRNYEVKVLGANGEMSAGFIRIDASNIRVTPSSISMNSGQRRPITFTIPETAPPGGLKVVVTTDVPNSVIMPDVVIPAGQRSTSVNVEGGDPGSGNIYVEVPGYSEVVLPISIN